MNDKLEALKAKLKEELEKGRVTLEANKKEKFYDLGYTDDGPKSWGNYDDTYSDGYYNGEAAGRYELAEELLKLLEE